MVLSFWQHLETQIAAQSHPLQGQFLVQSSGKFWLLYGSYTQLPCFSLGGLLLLGSYQLLICSSSKMSTVFKSTFRFGFSQSLSLWKQLLTSLFLWITLSPHRENVCTFLREDRQISQLQCVPSKIYNYRVSAPKYKPYCINRWISGLFE